MMRDYTIIRLQVLGCHTYTTHPNHPNHARIPPVQESNPTRIGLTELEMRCAEPGLGRMTCAEETIREFSAHFSVTVL